MNKARLNCRAINSIYTYLTEYKHYDLKDIFIASNNKCTTIVIGRPFERNMHQFKSFVNLIIDHVQPDVEVYYLKSIKGLEAMFL